MPQQFKGGIDGHIKNGAGSNFCTAKQEGGTTKTKVPQLSLSKQKHNGVGRGKGG